MASTVRSVDFLPEIFQTPVNKQFLAATLDQLIQEPEYRQTQGFIGQRVGPGVNPSDNYVVEPTKARTDYQLEPGVVTLDPESLKVTDAITYPGILDAISTQGGFTNKADRLFESEYYAWDPFVDFDKFTNYGQYYWLANGPDTVTVSATSIPTQQTFTVTRANGYYTFSGVAGNNPQLTLARNGQYDFKIAQNTANAIDYRVQNNGTSSWSIDYLPNPTLTLERGSTYTFNLIQELPLAFYIKTEESYGTTNLWNLGVTNNGATTGLVTFTVPQTAPDTLFYCNDLEFNLRGTLNIVDPDPGTGPDFWIQAAPGISGTMPSTPNISSRTVLGVNPNGIDLGTVNFDVPAKTAQDFYYTMPNIGYVNLIVGPDTYFNQLNGISVDQFKTNFPNGIDGVKELNNRTLVFTTPITDPESGGWQKTIEAYDPLVRTTGNKLSQQIGFDSWYTPPDITTPGVFDPLTRTTGNIYSAQVSYDVNGQAYDILPFETVTTSLTGTPDPEDGQVGSFDTIATAITGVTDPEDGLPGSYDFYLDQPSFDATEIISSLAEQFQIWQVQYVPKPSFSFIGTTTTGSVTVTNLAGDKVSQLVVGQILSGPGIPTGATITSINLNNNTLVLNSPATATGTTSSIIANVMFIQLNPYQLVDNLTQFTINYGTEYSNTHWYKNQSGFFQQQPLLTALSDYLYYQDGVNPAMFGIIKLVDENLNAVIDVTADILGKKNYTSPNGVTFTNGLKILFQGNVTPATYQNNEYYVYGVGTAIELILVSDFITPESYAGVTTTPYNSLPYSYGPYNASESLPADPDYITISMASSDRNPWTRSNRWFHTDVIQATAAYNNTAPTVPGTLRAKRPILEFRAGLNLYNFGTQGIPPVSVIDFSETNALLNVNGQTGYSIDGFPLTQDSLVIFAADDDLNVRKQIYQVNLIVLDPEASPTAVIDLVPTSYSPALTDQATVCTTGITQQGQSFYYNGTTWVQGQQKTKTNQAPLFNVYDSSGYSFGDTTRYPSSNFTGCKLLSYAQDITNAVDPVLGFPLAYFSLDNVGDILFDNNLYTDTFVYTPSGTGTTVNVSSGFVRQYADRTTFELQIGWQTATIPALPRQQFQFSYNGSPLQLDVLAETTLDVPAVQIFVNSVFLPPTLYTLTVNENTNTTVIILDGTGIATNDIIEVLVYSNQVSTYGFYEIPINLENNPFNGNSKQFSLGTARNHYGTICENLLDFQGTINGPNNTRDLGNIIPYGQQILQQSAPLTLAGYFLRDANYDIFASIEYNSREYIKYKSKLLNAVTQLDIEPNQTVSQILDAAIKYITPNLTSSSPFYWSDMLPTGTNYTSTVTTVNPITRATFNTIQTYDFTKSNYLGLLVYLNGRLLLRGTEYVVSVDSPRLTILLPLEIGDVVTINEYPTTVPSWCPNTPSKMGLYSKFKPEIFVDETYSEPTVVIRGHDGSITIAFADIRDQVLLEFEQRIYNNIKVDNNPIPLSTDEVTPLFYPEQSTALLPGFFRKTPYSYDEINTILSESFLSWVGQNKLDYTEQNYVASNPFTYNYSGSADRINQEALLQGNWRGLYRYFYDTETPNTTPWEMVGFSEMPSWWEQRYGPAPYTSGNRVLWDDLEAGIVGDITGPYVLPEYIRPGLTQVIPCGTEGELLPPTEALVGLTDPTSYQKSWIAGDGGPVQASWWKSSSYPFAIMRALALTKPAEFFSVFADRDLYRYDTTLGQYLLNGRYRLNASGVQVYGNGVSKASYINWIVDYKQQSGVNATTALTTNLANLDVRLCYRMAAFSDPIYVQLTTERAGAGSSNNSLEIPANSYNLMFYKNQPFGSITYSAVIIEVVELSNGNKGFTVFGYSNVQPYFDILVSSPVGLYTTIISGGVSVQVPSQYTTNTAQVPYGYTFTSTTSVCDFLLSYGAYLESQGLSFTDTFNNYELNWNQMCQEFLYFATQGWVPGTIINLNPCATKITATRPISIVDTIASVTPENMLLDQNRKAIDVSTMVVNRDGNKFSITTTSNQTINYLTLKFTNYEDMIVLDNTSQYNDLIYDPITAARQNRLRLVASTTIDWDGQLNAQGFILNLNNVKQWQAYTKYTKGQMVLYKNTYWQALIISEPQESFNYAEWVKTDYQAIQAGLLPNLANKADQLVDTYNVYQANLTSDNDLFAFGLIGFRPRQYMTDMNLNAVTQVQIYQQFLGTKGTRNAAQIFNNANLGKESGAYEIYENWGILSGTYGAQANKSYFELQLDESKLSYNPSTIQVVEPGEVSQANQQIYLSNLWRESYNITSTNILPTKYEKIGATTSLPSAGYVCLDDVDVTVFNIEDPSSIAADIDNIGIGTYIWIAKINSYDWGVYRTNAVSPRLTSLMDNLDGTSVAEFSNAHGLSKSDLIIIRYFDDAVNGVYRVLSTPTPTSITIAYTFTNTKSTTLTGSGIVFKLESARVNQASDIASLSFVNSLVPGAKVWVDKDANGHWETVQKQSPFVTDTLLNAGSTATDRFSTAIAQTTNNRGALIGAPGVNTIFGYYQDVSQQYQVSQAIVLTAVGTSNFGNSIVFGNNNWAVAGASTSLSGIGYAAIIYRNEANGNYTVTQLLLPPDQNFTAINFGASVTISNDERWMYVGAPLANTVYAYERIDVEQQSVSYVTDGYVSQFNYSDSIQINYLYPSQLSVTLGKRPAVAGIDYTISQSAVIFSAPPANNQELVITRSNETQLAQQYYYGLQPNSTTGSGVGAVFAVNFVRGIYIAELSSGGQNYTVGEVLTINGAQLGGITGVNDLIITVTVVSGNVITGFTQSGTGNYTTSTFMLNNWLYNATSISNFTITVNDQIQRPYYDYTFDPVTTALTFTSGSIPGLGAEIIASTPTYWQYVSSVTSSDSVSGDNFGFAVSTTTDGRQLIVGAPTATAATLTQAGSAYSFDRSVYRYIVSTPSQMTYTVPGTVNGPVAILVNNVFLLTTDQSLQGQFTVTGNNILFSNITFNYGDIIEIETNQFQQIQQVESLTPTYKANYGTATDSCPLDCSIYIGAPQDSTYVPQAGSVDHLVNQSRVYGVTTSTIANPGLQVGATLRINNTIVAVPALPNNTVAGFAEAINAANIPNVIATTTPDLVFAGDGETKVFNIGSLYSVAVSYTVTVYLNGILQQQGPQYSYDPSTTSIYFVNAPIVGSNILVVSGRLTLSVKNSAAATPQSMLSVLPGTNLTAFNQLGFNTFVATQQILSPALTTNGQFGTSISIDTSAINLIVGSPNGNIYEPTIFDSGKTYFDDHSTIFSNPVNNSGVAYTYDYFESSSRSITNPGKFVFGQQIYNDVAQQGDQFGLAVNYVNGRLIVGGTGNAGLNTTGYAAVFNNPTNTPSWKQIRFQQPVVDVYQLDGVFSYNGAQANGVNVNTYSDTQTYFDFFDPLQGKILGVARQNIDFIGAVDPAQYNTGAVHNNGNVWGKEHIGQMWWDTDTVRFIDPNQDDIVYASRRWGSTFPGSSVDVYQWIESSTPPASYTGSGTPLSTISYTIASQLGVDNVFTTLYYFWVRGITTVSTNANKTLSANGVASYITDPRSSGLPYIAGLNASTIAIYNAKELISGTNTILSIGFDRQLNDDVVHQEYQIITDGISNSFLNTQLYRKLQDSLCGIDTAGNAVPDPKLTLGMRYGVQFRPRQTMFADRFKALENYFNRANTVLLQYPISESRSFELLNASQPKPSANSGAWNLEVANLEILAFQNLLIVPVGYKYLVDTDSSQDGLWTIYEVTASKTLSLVQIQNYDTPLYWYYTNWYKTGYNSSVAPVAAVQNYGQLSTLTYKTVPVGSSVRVVNNGAGKWEIYQRTGTNATKDWSRVGLEDGTIQIKEELWNYNLGNFGFDSQVFDSQYYDETPQTETRYIIQALNEQIYIEDLEIERNSSLILLFNYVYSEFTNPSWLVKTSYVNVNHNIRTLEPNQTYVQDNQDFVLKYFQEVKPYHVQVRQFNLVYTNNAGNDSAYLDLTDYDLPAYWDNTLEVPQFVSPILNPYTVALTTNHSTTSDVDSNAQIWISPSLYSQWYNNYLLNIESVIVVNGGSEYTLPPIVTVTGDCVEQATMSALINSAGQVAAIIVDNPGVGYSSTAIITITGGNGSGAIAVAVMGNQLVRNIKTTIKYDRFQYQSSLGTSEAQNFDVTLFDQATLNNNPGSFDFTPIVSQVNWEPGGTYAAGAQVRYNNAVWQANAAVTNIIFDPSQWSLVDISTLSGVDRTMGYYVGTASQPGLSLPLLVDGIDYPGVQVLGLSFDMDTGFDRGPFDMTPYENLTISPEGFPTYDLGMLDTIYASSYYGPQGQPVASAGNFVIGKLYEIISLGDTDFTLIGASSNTVGLDFVASGTGTGTGTAMPLGTTAGDFIVGKSYKITSLGNTNFILIGAKRNEIGVDFVATGTGVGTGTAMRLGPGPDGTEIDAINIAGGAYVDVYSSHAPEELVPGATFDTLDMRVYTTPGADWQGLGHGFLQNLNRVTYTTTNTTFSFANQVPYPFAIEITDETQGETLALGTDYTIDWSAQTITFLSTGGQIVDNDIMGIYVYELGGGNQLYKQVYNGTVTNTLVVPIEYNLIQEFAIFVNGTPTTQFTYSNNTTVTYGTTLITFTNTYDTNDFISLVAIGETTENYSWSTPITQVIPAQTGIATYSLTNSLEYTNSVNAIVTLSGRRIRTPAGRAYLGNGTQTTFTVAQRLGIDQSTILPSDVNVYFNGILKTSGYTVQPLTAGTTVTFTTIPPAGTRIYITVSTDAQATIDPIAETVTFNGVTPVDGELIQVTTFNDTREQRLLTQVFVGPVTVGVTESQGFDTTTFDQGNLNNEPGSYDYTYGVTQTTNNLELGRLTPDITRPWVSLNGRMLSPNTDYTIEGTQLILASGILGPTDVVMVTQITNSVVPEAMEFRVFQDMRGVQAIYRMTPATTTTLTQELSSTDDIIHVADASALSEPDFAANLWGVITINGERIMYRERSLVNNTVSSLLRGTAGTANGDIMGVTPPVPLIHPVNTEVFDMGRGNLLNPQQQNYVVETTILADGSETTFVAPNIII